MTQTQTKFPGWRTMSGVERRNAKMHAMFERARQLERERRAQGLEPNPALGELP